MPALALRTRTALAAAALAAAVTLAPAASAIPPGGPAPTHNGAKVRLDRTAVKAGGRIKVVGTNWKSTSSRTVEGATVTVKIDDRDVLALLPIKGKRFFGWVRVPKQVKAGRHWLRFLASDPATSVKSATFKVSR
ncbi:hypothetical protein DSM104299_03979 [Baekduia alba]|uniref:hypothetical protein n=1 Tax=Baekduia alba TaxID=2997333 RepID=UPI002340E43B|nr:hypothetical protein [Baekduia alba]WCB95236.1 hypothetical protein DSM104299_03979 [Baekduia alba]